jgi:hypothetical protein
VLGENTQLAGQGTREVGQCGSGLVFRNRRTRKRVEKGRYLLCRQEEHVLHM